MPLFHDHSLSKSRGKSSRQISRSTPTTYLKWNRWKWRLIERTNLTSLPTHYLHYLLKKKRKKNSDHSDRPAENSMMKRRGFIVKKVNDWDEKRFASSSLQILFVRNDNFRRVNNCASFICSIDRSNNLHQYPTSSKRREKRGKRGGRGDAES